jgi:hypothetical protein
MARKAVGAVKSYAKQVPGDAKKVPGILKGFKGNGAKATAGALVKNKAVQVGAGAAGAAALATSGKKRDN